MRRENRGSNKNDKPSSYDSRKLKTWMLAEFGDGLTAPCAFCGKHLLYSEITKDRYPVPGRKGGRYVKGNIRPSCGPCNYAEGARQGNLERAEKRRNHEAKLARRRERYAQRKLDLTAV